MANVVTDTIGYAAKALACSAGIAALLITVHLVHGTAATWCQLVIGAATVAGVYRVPKGPRPGYLYRGGHR